MGNTIISLDTETIGIDHIHGSSTPFFVTTCNEDGEQTYWQWRVDPLTRKPEIPREDIIAIQSLIREADLLVTQNGSFDYKALHYTNPDFVKYWDWSKVRDTLVAGHMLNSMAPHNLTDMVIEYVGENIEKYEIKLKEASQSAQRWCRRHYPNWKIASGDLSNSPSIKSDKKSKTKGSNDSSAWKCDTWLPRAIMFARQELVQSDPAWAGDVAVKPKRPTAPLTKYLNTLDDWFPYTGTCQLVNVRHDTCDVRIDRTSRSKWGNPFTHLPLEKTSALYQVSSRKEAVSRYREWIQTQPDLLNSLWELDGKTLGCHCKSKQPTSPNAILTDIPCHGDVLAELLAAKRHPWWDVLEDYANKDSESTLALWFAMEKEITRRKLWKIFHWASQTLPITPWMERRGVTVSEERANHISSEFKEASTNAKSVCLNIASSFNYNLELPKGASPNESLRHFILDVMKLPPQYNKKAKTGAPTVNKVALEHYVATIPRNTKQSLFIRSLLGARARDTSIAFIENYRRFWLPYEDENDECVPGWYVLHPNLNQTGTGTTRYSCTTPNGQNCSRKGFGVTCPRCHGSECDYCNQTGEVAYNIRHIFGPAPNREWWSCDGSNLEVRLPAYLSGEKELIALFEKPNDPPYFGSNHLLNFSIVYPEIWEPELSQQMVNPEHIKKKYKSTNYTWVKNVWFGLQYSAGEATTDASARKKGAHKLLKSKLSKLLGPGGLNERQVKFAEKHGYIETAPDKTVDPDRGYPLMCKRAMHGGVLPTTPLSYYIQGSGGWWIRKATMKVYDFLQRINSGETFAGRKWPGGYYIILQVHDELLYDFPSGKVKGGKPHEYNLPIITEVRRLMESAGTDISVPIPVTCEYHDTSWAEGVVV